MPKGRAATHFTPERVACVAERYAAGAARKTVLAAVNLLPGPEITAPALRTRMLRMGLIETAAPYETRKVKSAPTAAPREGPREVPRRRPAEDAAAPRAFVKRPMYAGYSMLGGRVR